MNSPIEAVDAQFLIRDSRSLRSKIVSSLRERGWISTALCGILYLARRCQSFYYDFVHGVSTRQGIPISKMDFAGESAAYAFSYEASDTNCVRNLLSGLDIEFEKFEFVDLGAGKGRTLLVAAEFPFRRIWGSELSPTLAETARRNCKNFRGRDQACKNFEVVCGDAAEFSFPKAPLVIYLFNPFCGPIVARVLQNLMQSWQEHPREIFVAYHHAVHGHLFERSPIFEPFGSGTDTWDYRKLRYQIFHTKSKVSWRSEDIYPRTPQEAEEAYSSAVRMT